MSAPLKPIHRKRLLKVARALREAADSKNFTMDIFGFAASADDEKATCGTPACALGHYAARRDLQKTFKLNKFGDLIMNTGRPFPTGINTGIFFTGGPIAEHFGLSQEEMEKLFSSEGCNYATTPIAAAKFIEKFVRNHP